MNGGPITAEEMVYGEAYAEFLAVGSEKPDDGHLDPRRAAEIREALDRAWRAKVRRIYRRKG